MKLIQFFKNLKSASDIDKFTYVGIVFACITLFITVVSFILVAIDSYSYPDLLLPINVGNTASLIFQLFLITLIGYLSIWVFSIFIDFQIIEEELQLQNDKALEKEGITFTGFVAWTYSILVFTIIVFGLLSIGSFRFLGYRILLIGFFLFPTCYLMLLLRKILRNLLQIDSLKKDLNDIKRELENKKDLQK